MLPGSLDGRGVWERMDTCTLMADSLCCAPEAITLFISYTPIKKKNSELGTIGRDSEIVLKILALL